MTYSANVINVMIASPSDVPQERRLIRDVIDEWNAINAQHRAIILMPLGWETHGSPEIGDRPQGVINKQILKDCDLLIGVFWTRLGSPTGKAASGTVEEIEEHLNSGKQAMIYFSAAPVRPDSVDGEQYAALKKFKDDIRGRGLIEEYESVSEFREKLSRHLAQTINRQFSNLTANSPAIAGSSSAIEVSRVVFPRPPAAPTLSDEARELLLEASKDPNGTIVRIGTLGGTLIQTNRRNFITSRDNRTVARWRGAVDQLHNEGLVEDRGHKGEVFALTNKGYEVADLLINSA